MHTCTLEALFSCTVGTYNYIIKLTPPHLQAVISDCVQLMAVKAKTANASISLDVMGEVRPHPPTLNDNSSNSITSLMPETHSSCGKGSLTIAKSDCLIANQHQSTDFGRRGLISMT